MERTLLSGERGVSSVQSYAILLAVSSIILIGISSGAASIVDTNQDRAAQSELNVIGNKVAAEVMQVDSLRSISGGAPSSHSWVSLPGSVAGGQYIIEIQEDPDRVIVRSVTTDKTATVPMEVENDLEETTIDGGDIIISVSGGGETQIEEDN